jgi:hypothetical protein
MKWEWKRAIKNRVILIWGKKLFQSALKILGLLRQSGNKWSQEVRGTFVKSSNRSGEWKKMCAKIWEVTKYAYKDLASFNYANKQENVSTNHTKACDK